MDEAGRRDVAERAKAIYEGRIRPLVEAEHFGKVVSIDVESGDYEVAADPTDEVDALGRLRDRHRDPQVFRLRVGYRTLGRIGGARWKLGEGERL